MQTNVAKREVETTGDLQQNTFSISMGPGMFKILTSSIYSDVQRISMQEPICNAIDANVLAGNGHIPVEIHFPTSLDPYFAVVDQGPGLSHDDVMRLYTTYGKSTKSETNSAIGGFGLGSKAPLAYTDTFEVTSWHGGKASVYAAYIGENGTPTIALLTCDPSDHAPGLQVKFPVKREDISQFLSKGREILCYLDPAPRVMAPADFQPATVEYTDVQGKDWKFRTTLPYVDESEARIIMGGIPYAINYSAVYGDGKTPSWQLRHEPNYALCRAPLDIFVPIGAVSPSVSRDVLSYDDATIATIKARVTRIILEYKAKLSAHLSQANTLWEAKIIAGKILSNSLASVLFGGKVQWNGQDITSSFGIDKFTRQLPSAGRATLPQPVSFFTWGVNNYRRRRPDTTHRDWTISAAREDISINPGDSVALFWAGPGRSNTAQRCHAYIQGLTPVPTVYYLCTSDDPATLAWFKTATGDGPVIDVSTLPAIKTVRVPAMKRTLADVKLYDRNGYPNWTDHQVQVTDGGIYSQLERSGVIDFKPHELARSASEYMPDKYYGIPRKSRGIEIKPGWTLLGDWQRAKFQENIKALGLPLVKANAAQFDLVPSAVRSFLDNIGTYSTIPRLARMAADYRTLYDAKNLWLTHEQAETSLGIIVPEAKTKIHLNDDWTKIEQELPLLGTLKKISLTGVDKTNILAYIQSNLKRKA